MQQMQDNAQVLAGHLHESGRFEVIGSDLEQLPLTSDLFDALTTLDQKGGAHAAERNRVKQGTGY